MKVTTKTGDEGYTDLVDGRVLKCDDRVEAYGCVDELNTQVGMLHFLISDGEQKKQLEQIMDLVRNICRDLANSNQSRPYKITSEDTLLIEEYTQAIKSELKELKLFQRPIGNQVFNQANIVRAITRRAERRIIKLKQISNINDDIIPLINRLSDYFFILSKRNQQ